MQDKKEELSWYRKLKLSQKYKLNVAIGMLLVVKGVAIMAISGSEMLHHWQYTVHAAIGALVLCAGLWLFGVGVRYQSQLEAIRIARRNSGGYRKQQPKKKA